MVGERFFPPRPDDSPDNLFAPAWNRCSVPAVRYIRRSNPREGLVFIDGSCVNNGRPDARAGFSVVFCPDPNLQIPGAIKSRLEMRGPDGRVAPQTSNRAELRAAIAALQFRFWPGEGFNRFVIASDSEYVVKGATEWGQAWLANNWYTSNGTPVENQDLWRKLFTEIDNWNNEGLKILFWHIPREKNTLADRLAKEATDLEPRDSFGKIHGVAC